jgi:hypothetical protein
MGIAAFKANNLVTFTMLFEKRRVGYYPEIVVILPLRETTFTAAPCGLAALISVIKDSKGAPLGAIGSGGHYPFRLLLPALHA